MDTLPPLFISHGSPMTALEPRAAGAFWRRLGQDLLQHFGRPQALLVVSAHSLTSPPVRHAADGTRPAAADERAVPLLLAAPRHEAIYDFGGFDPKLRTLRYDAAGAPALAARAAALLQAAGVPAQTTPEGGLDHGIWVPLRELFPQADIPVLPLAWPASWTPARLYAAGQALAPLAAEGVLVIGSGSITHNLQRVFAGGLRTPVDQPATPESTAFRDWWAERAAARDWDALCDYRTQAPHAALMHPTDEHLLPWFVAAGAGGRAHGARRLHDSLTFGDLGMDVYAFGAAAARLAGDAAPAPVPAAA